MFVVTFAVITMSDHHHSVYVILLDEAVALHPSVLRLSRGKLRRLRRLFSVFSLGAISRAIRSDPQPSVQSGDVNF